MNQNNSWETSGWVQDINNMHNKYNVQDAVDQLDDNMLNEFLALRVVQLQEELSELQEAIDNDDAEEVVDALIDLSVFAIGTLDLFGIDSDKAWASVYNANMTKEVGVKEGRPNPFGLPDLIKPKGWVAPSHEGNHGKFKDMFK